MGDAGQTGTQCGMDADWSQRQTAQPVSVTSSSTTSRVDGPSPGEGHSQGPGQGEETPSGYPSTSIDLSSPEGRQQVAEILMNTRLWNAGTDCFRNSSFLA